MHTQSSRYPEPKISEINNGCVTKCSVRCVFVAAQYSLRRLGSLFHPSPLPPVSTRQLLTFPPLRHWALGIRNYTLLRNAGCRRGRTVGVRAISTPGWAFVQTKRTWLLTSFAHFRENGPQICSGLGKGQCQYCPSVEYRRHDRSALCLITMRVRHVLLTRHYSVW